MALLHHKESAYQSEDATAIFGHSDRLLLGSTDCYSGFLKHNATGHIDGITSLKRSLGNTGTCFLYPVVIDVLGNSTSSWTTSSYSLRDSRQLQFAYSSKEVCDASSVKESEAMRKWKEIKQNGFLSHPNGGVPVPEPQRGKRSKKRTKISDLIMKMSTAKSERDNRKSETAKLKQNSRKMIFANGRQDGRKMETENGEHDQRKMKIIVEQHDSMLKNAPSSGLLSSISTGIIRRVKNYEEVHAILEDIVRLEKKFDCLKQN